MGQCYYRECFHWLVGFLNLRPVIFLVFPNIYLLKPFKVISRNKQLVTCLAFWSRRFRTTRLQLRFNRQHCSIPAWIRIQSGLCKKGRNFPEGFLCQHTTRVCNIHRTSTSCTPFLAALLLLFFFHLWFCFILWLSREGGPFILCPLNTPCPTFLILPLRRNCTVKKGNLPTVNRMHLLPG